ncbi:MAG: HPF/RaiA family ribosome-associated protein [Burkholderiales bacterium]|nr:HPF/RaiA family ribosome-associated protein [Burkholderiales bacterium]
MQVLFESRHPQGDQLRGFAVRRTVFVMRRVTQLVPRARIQLSDLNGPRGGVDKQCRIELATDGAGHIVASSTARTWRGALNAALARAVRAVMRLWRRGREAQRPRQAQAALGHDS